MSDAEGPKIKAPASMDDALRGYRYIVTLSPSVPLEVLQKAGELCLIGKPCPNYGDDSVGIWIPETKSLAEMLGKKPKASPLDSSGWRKEVAASFLGPVATGSMLDFLKSFRAIVEGNLAVDAKKESVRKLCGEANASDELDGLFTGRQVEYLLSYCK